MKNIYWKYIAVIFIVLNVVLLYDKNVKIKESIVPENRNNLVENYFPDIIESKFINYPNKGVKAFFFINDNGCVECIAYEVEKLNELNQNFKEKIEIFLIGKDSTYLTRLYGATFEYKNIPDNDFSRIKINSLEPFAFVVDKNGYVQQNYFAVRKKLEITDKFYLKLSSLLSSI